MQKRINSKEGIVYMPENYHQDVMHNIVRGDLIIDENFKYKRKKLSSALMFLLYYGIAKPIFYFYGKLFLGVKIKGKKNLKGIKTGAVTVSNHVHYFDFSIATTFIGRFKRSHIIANKESFLIPVAGKLIAAYGVMPLPDTPKASVNFYRQINEYLKKKRFIHIFPEASMWPYYTEIRPFKPGAFHFAYKNNVPIIPYVIGFRKSKGVARKRPKINVYICKPIYPDTNIIAKQEILNLCEKVTHEMKQALEENPSYEFWKYVKQPEDFVEKLPKNKQ